MKMQFYNNKFRPPKCFLNVSASVNPSGGSCPTALKMVACVLMLEITAFLRETYKQLPRGFVKVPKSETSAQGKAEGPSSATVTGGGGHRAHSRDHGILHSTNAALSATNSGQDFFRHRGFLSQQPKLFAIIGGTIFNLGTASLSYISIWALNLGSQSGHWLDDLVQTNHT